MVIHDRVSFGRWGRGAECIPEPVRVSKMERWMRIHFWFYWGDELNVRWRGPRLSNQAQGRLLQLINSPTQQLSSCLQIHDDVLPSPCGPGLCLLTRADFSSQMCWNSDREDHRCAEFAFYRASSVAFEVPDKLDLSGEVAKWFVVLFCLHPAGMLHHRVPATFT